MVPFTLPHKDDGLVGVSKNLLSLRSFPNPWLHFNVPPNLDAHPASMSLKAMCCNLATFTTDYKNKWDSVGLTYGYYVVWVIAIPYPVFGVLLNIVSKEDTSYHVTTDNIPHYTCPNFTKKNLVVLWEREGNGCIANIYTMCLSFCARWTMIVTSSFTLQCSPSTKS